MAFDNYTQLAIPDGSHLELCPCCACTPEIWQFQKEKDGPASKAVMCSNGAAFGPQDGIVNEGCLLNMPPDDFYKATIREAVKYWNEYAKALTAQQRSNRWKAHQVLRTADKQEPTP